MKKFTKVLIVDDEQQNVKIIKEMLGFHPQYECRDASSGEEALTILNTYFPEIVLLDVMMPGIDGYEVCERIRSQNHHKFSKIIMISGMSLIDDRLKGYGAGADDYLTKPFVEDELLAKLQVYSKLSRMEEVDTLKTTALNILNHETRTPLNGIILGSELLREMDCLSDKAKKYVEMVRESGLRIQELVEKISRYYFIKDGIEKNLSENSMCLVIDNIINSLGGFCRNVGVKIDCHCDKDIKLVADWGLLTEALSYVIDNAYKNSPQSAVVTIVCERKGPSVCIQVGDQGAGVDPSLTERVFDGLFLPDLLHNRQGTGLSLAIAKEIIDEHGGRISCRNREGGGTLFEIIL
ncbi:MAG: hybrid sensor histidine kinase/response regulator [Desulforhopalus sp.]